MDAPYHLGCQEKASLNCDSSKCSNCPLNITRTQLHSLTVNCPFAVISWRICGDNEITLKQ